MELSDLHAKVIQFVARENPDLEATQITPETNLIAAHLQDSDAIERFVLFVEGLLDREIPIIDFHMDAISSTALIHRNFLLQNSQQ